MKAKYPLWIALVIYWSSTFTLLYESFKKTGGHFGYPLDDTYIHMAIGRHFANDGIWGVSQNTFSSSTSSPLWTLLLAATYKILGVRDWIPFFICLICGSLVILTCYSLFKENYKPIQMTFFLVSVILSTLLPILTLTGMEHILHGLFSLWLIHIAVVYLTQNEPTSRQLTLLLLSAGLVTITRYEGIFLVFAIVLLLLIQKRFWVAFLIIISSILPITIYGIISISQGWYFLPNSVLLKGNSPVLNMQGIFNFLLQLPANLIFVPHILVLIIACSGIYVWCKKQGYTGKVEGYLTAIFITITLLHMQFARVGWFYRYEAYLILIGCVVLFKLLSTLFKNLSFNSANKYAVMVCLAILFIIPFTWRITWSFQQYPTAVVNIYEQQYQMGLFLQKYYSGKAIAANDIGAINYLADIKTLDLFGLGSIDVARAKRNGSYDMITINRLASTHNVEVIIIYEEWFKGNIPAEWIEIGRWKINNNIVCAFDEIVFYAPNKTLEKEVTANLIDFSNKLPSTIEQSGKYTIR